MWLGLVAFGLLLSPLAVEAAQSPPAPVSVNGDAVTWRRDPFIGDLKKGGGPTATKGTTLKTGAALPKLEQEQDIQLQGIMQVDKKFHALINGRSVKAGDTIRGVTIKQISRYQVVVLNEHKEKIIYDIYQGRIDRGKK